MPEIMDGGLEAAFSLLGISPQKQAEFDAARAATAATVAELEARHADRGLHFTQPFYGMMPVQAFGHIDGQRFYFRFRHNSATLQVGPYDPEIEQLTYERRRQGNERHRQADLALLAAGQITQERLDEGARMRAYNTPRGPVPEYEPAFLPTRITASASVMGPGAKNSELGDLTEAQALEIFSALVTALAPVPEEEQLHPRTRIWLYEGWEAAEAYDKKVTARITREIEAAGGVEAYLAQIETARES